MKPDLRHLNKFFVPVAGLSICIIIFLTAQKPIGDNTNKPDSLGTYGKASFYANKLQGLNTSSGDIYDKNDFTCAHRKLPFNTILSVTNIANGKSTIVRVNDRGPYRKGRIIDLSRAAAQKLGMVPNGVIRVKIQELSLLEFFPLNDGLLQEGMVIDSRGNEKQIQGHPIKVWETQDLRHAIYMAASIENEHPPDSVFIKVKGEGDSRAYVLLLPNKDKKEDADKLMAALKQDGFSNCRIDKNQK